MLPSWLDRAQRTALLLTALLYSAGYGTIGLFLILLTVAAEGIVMRRIPWRRSPLDLPIAAFVGVFLVSGFLSPYRPFAVGSLGLGALTIYLAFGTFFRVLRRDPGYLWPTLAAWIAGGVVAAAWALVLHRRTGLPAFTPELGQNAVGTTTAIALILSLGLLTAVRSSWRIVLAACAGLLAAGLAASYTRGAWLGALAGILVLAAIVGARQSLRVLAPLAVVAVVGLILVVPEGGSLARRIATIVDVNVNADRVFLYKAALQIIRSHPLIGTGLNTFPIVYPQYRLPGDVNAVAQPYAHNMYLNMAAEGGILGFLTFVSIVVQGLRVGIRWLRESTPPSHLLPGTLIAAFAAAMVHQLFDGTLLSVHLGLGMWLLLAGLAARPRASAPSA